MCQIPEREQLTDSWGRRPPHGGRTLAGSGGRSDAVALGEGGGASVYAPHSRAQRLCEFQAVPTVPPSNANTDHRLRPLREVAGIDALQVARIRDITAYQVRALRRTAAGAWYAMPVLR